MKKQITILTILLLSLGSVAANEIDMIQPDDGDITESPVEFNYDVEVDQDSTVYLLKSEGYGNQISYDNDVDGWINVDTGAEVNFDAFVEAEHSQSDGDNTVSYNEELEMDAGEYSWYVMIDTEPSTEPDGNEMLGPGSWSEFDVEAKPPVLDQFRILPDDTIETGTDFEVDYSAHDPNGQDLDIILDVFESGTKVDTVTRSYGSQISDGISRNEFDYDFGEGDYSFEMDVYNEANEVTTGVTSLAITDDDGGDLNSLSVSLSGDQVLEEGETGNFNADLFANGEGTVEYQFIIDGSPQGELSTDSTINHVFDEPGIYEIEVTAQDSEGQEDTDVMTVSVEEEEIPFEAKLNTPNQMEEGEMFELSLESESIIATADWKIDGSEINPVETTSTSLSVELPAGIYSVDVDVEGADGRTDSINESIEVEGDETNNQNLIWVGLGLLVILISIAISTFMN